MDTLSRGELVELIDGLERRLTDLHIVMEAGEGSPCQTCRLIHRARAVVREERQSLTVPGGPS